MGCIFSLAWLISTSPILSAVPLPFMWTLCSSGIQVSFRGNYATCCCRFVVSLGRYEFKIFLCCHLEPSLSSFTFIKKLFSSSSLSAIKVVSSAYVKLLIFLPAVLIPACASSSPVFHMMYSVYKLNKQGDNIQPFPDLEQYLCSMTVSNYCFLTCIDFSGGR